MWGSPLGKDWAGVEAWPLLGREDRVATECTRDEQLPVLQGQVPLHKHTQRDLVVDQALPAAEPSSSREQRVHITQEPHFDPKEQEHQKRMNEQAGGGQGSEQEVAEVLIKQDGLMLVLGFISLSCTMLFKI